MYVNFICVILIINKKIDMKKIIIVFLVFSNFLAFSQNDSTKVIASTIPVVAQSKPIKKGVEVFLLSNIGGGVLISTQKINSEAERDFVNSLRKGLVFDLGFYFKLNKNSALGFKYNSFGSSGQITRSELSVNGLVSIDEDEKLGLNFYCLSYLINLNNSKSPHDIFLELSAGYLTYNQEAAFAGSLNNQKVNLPNDLTYAYARGNTIGFLIGFAYKYRVSENFSFGPNVNYSNGTITEVELKEPGSALKTVKLTEEKYVGLARFDFSVGATYKFWLKSVF